MNNKLFSHSISPKKILRGEKAWEEGKTIIPLICKRPLILGRSNATKNIRNSIHSELVPYGLNPIPSELKYDCCELDLSQLKKLVIEKKCDGIIAAGGGKVLDAGKLLSNRLSLPCITIPTSASTCAGWTSLSNIYSSKGAFIKDVTLDSCPELLIFDYSFIRQAPPRTLASGIADALAKWYESSSTSNAITDGLVQQAVQMARVLRDQLFIDGHEAFLNPKSEAWIRVAEGCGLTAGLIGGVGGSRCRTAAAHAIHNGLTQLIFSKKSLHGEIVIYGVLVQLYLEEVINKSQLAKQASKQLIQFLTNLDLPTNLIDLNIEDTSIENLKMACEFACRDESDIHRLPFKVNKNILLEALTSSQDREPIVKLKTKSKTANYLESQ